MAGNLLVPGLATLWTAGYKFSEPVAPAASPLTLAGGGALVVNLTCTLMLTHYRSHSGSLTRAAFLSARNDVLMNITIVTAGLVTAFLWRSAWPELIVGLFIILINLDATREVWKAARQEHRDATEQIEP